jgi:hypothetical protein
MQLWESLKNAGQAAAQGTAAVTATLTVPITATNEAILELTRLATDPLFAPHIEEIKKLQAQINEQAKRLEQLSASPQNKQGVSALIADMSAKLMRQISSVKTMSAIEARKSSGQYSANTEGFQKTIDFAVQNKMTIRQMYDQAARNQGANYANNLISKYRTVYPDPDTALVKPAKLA